MRNPVASGFYPSDKEALKKTIETLLSEAKTADLKDVTGAIVPHAGYAYSGFTAACAYNSLSHTCERVVLLGTNHTGLGREVAISFDDWATPLGVVKNDVETGKKICTLSKYARHDEVAHTYEHSIEVQLPFLQIKMRNFKIVPIVVSSGLMPNVYSEIAESIKVALSGEKKNTIVIASSDFTHYGRMYDFEPPCADPKAWVYETDRGIIDAILSCRLEEFLNLAQGSTVCGAGAIATLIKFVGEKRGRLVDYRTSCDVSGDKSAIVGYSAILF